MEKKETQIKSRATKETPLEKEREQQKGRELRVV